SGLSAVVVDDENPYAYTTSADGLGLYGRDPSSGALTFIRSYATGGNSPLLFRDLRVGFLLGVNARSANCFSFELDPGDPFSYRSPISTGEMPIPGGVLLNISY